MSNSLDRGTRLQMDGRTDQQAWSLTAHIRYERLKCNFAVNLSLSLMLRKHLTRSQVIQLFARNIIPYTEEKLKRRFGEEIFRHL
jgi:hypothetical protein